MQQHAIFYPIAAMVLLTLIVTVCMLKARIDEMKQRRIHPQKVASSTQMNAVLENTKASDNYKNLFELPVLFYVLCLALFAAQMVSPAWLTAAWAYVILRYVHSAIHITYNHVYQRFYVFATSLTVLSGMWGVFVYQLLAKN